MREKLERIKAHLREHQTVYIVGGVLFVSGVAVGVICSSNSAQSVTTKVFGNWKSSVTVNNIIEQQLVRRGHPGFKIRCVQTGEEFASISRAAKMLDVSRKGIQDYLKGEASDVKGLTFQNLGEMS